MKSFIVLISVGILIFIGLGCNSKLKKSNKEIRYLDIDSVYRTPEEKTKFYTLRDTFLKIWLSPNNCFAEAFIPNRPDSHVKKVLDIRVDNILHTPTYDSVVVLVGLYAAWIEKDGSKNGDITFTYPMKAVISKEGNWQFDCRLSNFGFYNQGNQIDKTLKSFRRMIIASGYLKNGKPDPNYIHNLFSKEVEFPKSDAIEFPEMEPVK